MAIKPIQILINAKDEASGVFDKLQTKIAAVGAAVLGYFGVKAFAGAVNSAADFEQAMSRVQAATGASGEEFGKLRAAAEEAGATTKFTATESAAALENLAKAGLSSADAIATLPAVLQLAQAGDIELAQASEMLTKAVMGMGLAFEDAGRVADVLALGANATNTSVEGLSQALSYAAPVANALSVSLESTTAMLGKMADAGIDASRAGTSLNNIMSQFGDPLSTFRKELAAAGITTTNFEKALHQLAAAGPAGEKAINAVGLNAGPALRALLNQGMGALDDLTEKLRNASGSAAETAAVMENNLKGSLNGISSAWDTVVNALATPVLPVLKDGVDRLSAALRTAVSDGTITKFGQAIAAMFQAGVEWAKKFAESFNWDAATTSLNDFAGKAGGTFERIGNQAIAAGNAVRTVWGVMAAGTNTLLALIFKVGEVFAGMAAGIQNGLALIMEGFAKVTFGNLSKSFSEAAKSVRESAKATAAVSYEYGRQARLAFIALGEGAEMAREGWAGLKDSIQEGDKAAGGAAPKLAALGTAAADAGKAAEEAAAKTKKAADRQLELAEKSEKAKAALAELRSEYEQAVADKNWQLAAELMVKLKNATDDATKSQQELAREAKEAAARVSAAFAAAGIQTKSELETMARTAREQYEIIKQSGQATADGLAEAWKKAAEAAIKANNGIAPGWVQAEASARGYAVEVDNAGKATIKAADTMSAATGRMVRDWGGVRHAVRAASDELLDFEKRSKAISDANTRGTDAYRKKWGVDNNNMSTNTNGQLVVGMENEAQLNSRVRRLFGDDMVGNPNAIKAANIQAELDQARAYGINNSIKGNAEYFQALRDELNYLNDLINSERASNRAASATTEAEPRQPTGVSMAAGPVNYITNITIGEDTEQLRFADRESQLTAEALLRRISQAKGASS